MKKGILTLSCLLFSFTVYVTAEIPTITLSTISGAMFPLGTSNDYFTPGFETSFVGNFEWGDSFPLSAAAGIDYAFIPTRAETSISNVAAYVQGTVGWRPADRILMRAYGSGGYSFGMHNQASVTAGSLLAETGLDFVFIMNKGWDMGLRSGWRYVDGLYNGIRIGLGISYALTGKEVRETRIKTLPYGLELYDAKTPKPGEGIDVVDIELLPVFPVFYSHYDSNSLGSIILKNLESKPIESLKVDFFLPQYMDTTKQCFELDEMKADSTLEIDLFALFTERVLGITEGTKASAEITLEYVYKDDKYRDVHSHTVEFRDRNAMTWDDTRKVAAFVTPKDPVILNFSKNVASIIREERITAVNKRTEQALALFSALDEYGLAYQVDPSTPFSELSTNTQAVDYIQFPRQTLKYRGGDCDDLSILFCALLESTSIPTAFITVPGHIFMAFDTGLTAADGGVWFSNLDKLIEKDGRMWMPLEMTIRDKGFMTAWREGVSQWGHWDQRGRAEFWPVEEAWIAYAAVGLPGGDEENIPLPTEDSIMKRFKSEMDSFVDRELLMRIDVVQAAMKRDGKSPAVLNRLGILYARYGRIHDAAGLFREAVGMDESYVPAMMNLGNTAYLTEQMTEAERWYRKILDIKPDYLKAEIALGRVCDAIGRSEDAQSHYDRVIAMNPALAAKYSLDSSSGNRARSTEKGDPLWTE